jgi:hypothetical protein
MSILIGDRNAKNPVWDPNFSNPSRLKLLELFVSYSFEISAAQYSTHYTPDDRVALVIDILEHQNVRLSKVTATGTLVSDHLAIMFSIPSAPLLELGELISG